MTLKLISFKLCPFVHRAAILLREKNLEPEVAYIDLENKPEWFLELSPRGKVPVLVADGVPIFESQAICEYLEEVVPEPPLMPADPILRARDRGWFAYASEELFTRIFRLDASPDGDKVKQTYEELGIRLDRLESELAGRDYLSGDGTRFGMADVAMAPFLFRLNLLKELGLLSMGAGRPNFAGWLDRIASRPSVSASVVPEFADLMSEFRARKQAWLLENHRSLAVA